MCRYYPLKIRFLAGEHARLRQGCLDPPSHMDISVGPLQDMNVFFQDIDTDEDDEEGADDSSISTLSRCTVDENNMKSCFGSCGASIEPIVLVDEEGDSLEAPPLRTCTRETIDSIPTACSDATAVDASVHQAQATQRVPKRRTTACAICSKAANRMWVVCGSCERRSHVECLAEHSLQMERSSPHIGSSCMDCRTPGIASTLPRWAICASCRHRCPWIDVLGAVRSVGWGSKHRSHRETSDAGNGTKQQQQIVGKGTTSVSESVDAVKIPKNKRNGIQDGVQVSMEKREDPTASSNATCVQTRYGQSDGLSKEIQRDHCNRSIDVLTSCNHWNAICLSTGCFRARASLGFVPTDQGAEAESASLSQASNAVVSHLPPSLSLSTVMRCDTNEPGALDVEDDFVDLSSPLPLALRLKERALTLRGTTAQKREVAHSPDIIELLD